MCGPVQIWWDWGVNGVVWCGCRCMGCEEVGEVAKEWCGLKCRGLALNYFGYEIEDRVEVLKRCGDFRV